jgi:ribonuclease P protein component
MLPKKKRVTKEVFQVLMKEGKTLSTRLFLLHFIKKGPAQYAFVAPKKNFKNSVLRNKYRRIGYNTIRKLPLKAGLGVFIYKKQAVLSTKKEIEDEILLVLNKAGF